MDSCLIKRYQATCDNTLMNAGERPRERAAKQNELEEILKSLERYYERLQDKNFENYPAEIKELIFNQFQKGQSALRNILQYPNFKKMIRQLLEQYLKENPKFRLILDNKFQV
jgi:hypothetical protein